MGNRKALILSGGSVKGAFQAGAIKACPEKGFQPDLIYGISVGSLNGSFLSNEAGKLAKAGKPIDWPKIGNANKTKTAIAEKLK